MLHSNNAVAILTLLGLSCMSCGAPRPSDAVVYSCFLDGWVASNASQGVAHSCVVLVDSTVSGPEPNQKLSAAEIKDMWLRLQKHMPTLRSDTLGDFVAQNQMSGTIDTRNIGTTVPVIGLPEAEAIRIFTLEQCWDVFYKRFPQARGVMRLSRVGCSREAKQVLLYCDFSGGFLAGVGWYYLLDGEGDRWQITAESVARQA